MTDVDKRAELIVSIIRLLNMADAKELGCIYHFALHLVRGVSNENPHRQA